VDLFLQHFGGSVLFFLGLETVLERFACIFFFADTVLIYLLSLNYIWSGMFYRFVCLFICLFVCLLACLFVCFNVCLFACLF
jgi:hypothetical protein